MCSARSLKLQSQMSWARSHTTIPICTRPCNSTTHVLCLISAAGGPRRGADPVGAAAADRGAVRWCGLLAGTFFACTTRAHPHAGHHCLDPIRHSARSCPAQITFPGAYRCVCVELRISHLAVNAILEVRRSRDACLLRGAFCSFCALLGAVPWRCAC